MIRFLKVFFIAIICFGFFGWAEKSFAWTWTADFEQGVNNTRALGTSGYNGADTGTQTLFSNMDAHTGSQSSLFNWTTPDVGYSQCTGEIDYPANLVEGDEIWLRAYYKFQNGWSWNNVSGSYGTKILRSHNRHTDGSNGKYTSIMTRQQGDICLSMEPSIEDHEYCTGVLFDIGQWQSIELYIKLSSTAGITRIWKNGILLYETTAYRTIEQSSDLANYGFVMSTWNGGVGQDQQMWVDDIMVTSEVPHNTDADGNYMIGPTDWNNSVDTTPPSAPLNLAVQ